MKRKSIIFGSITAAALLFVCYLYTGSNAPKGQQPLVRLNNSNLASLKDAFNASAKSVRLLVLVSPTCPVCLKGGSAIENLLAQQKNSDIRAFVVWEPVLMTDFGAPSTATLKRVSDLRASQYWDKDHLVSHLLGEHDRHSVVWDYVAVYEPGKLWEQAPPEPASSGAPVIRAIGRTTTTLQQMLQSAMK